MVVAPSLPATPIEETPSVPATPRCASKEGSEDHHSGPDVGSATRIDSVDHSSQTPPLLSRMFQGHLEGTRTDPCPQHKVDHGV